MLELIEPSVKYQASFLDALSEYRSLGEPHHAYDDLAEDNFQNFLFRLEQDSRGEFIAEGKVPQSFFWLVDSGLYIGRVAIRHKLNDKLRRVGGHIGYTIRPSERQKGYGKKILKMALPKARGLGLVRALVTCDETNVASRKIIESCGGVLEDAMVIANTGKAKLRFWIDLNDVI
ncbi:MAG: GNAT family N-acetyltransferase [Candidatus Kerfeldbacteria bacterium CG15_BIG_FIL_POST_REV_8_21_14_020_45_12]|uniref:GNAT family N-acetyltransferase n=1 Tax=Candidatus Kerfeldbacteria bacterium CG15_BIG_FIL_POST_REV_8_21_14_020_45_12 TaxID=2014247 RepID=A0A2M7H529_9BACT|nr:MAG: GNAT family N-acetyltransferase [Candidatus Kerfeldbacteria bacterium CG15_BIG_FIL_POST_REV_8_21_14_020_45_12]PJA93142.1 MAG: GNAT family N-acetyltransferase [Candidatus Kerfeldbacteria bacterium CG_4_9_14_3_um_filter_45_8]